MKPTDINFLKEYLKKQPGILGSDRYVNAAVLIPLVKIDEGYHLLFEVRKKNIRQGGEICFPGGRIDTEDKNPLEAALRETYEEIGVLPKDVEVIGQMDTLVTKQGIIIYIFVGVISEETYKNISINPDEVERIFIVDINKFFDTEPEVYQARIEIQPHFINADGKMDVLLPSEILGLPQKYHKPWGHHLYPIYFYQIGEELIWGMTADMIRELVKIWKQ